MGRTIVLTAAHCEAETAVAILPEEGMLKDSERKKVCWHKKAAHLQAWAANQGVIVEVVLV